MKKRALLPFLLALSAPALSACEEMPGSEEADDPDATRVFAANKTAAPNNLVITGIWEGAQPQTSGPLTSTSRFEFRDSFIVAAARCTRGSESVLVGGRSPGAVTNELVEIRQAISDQRSIGSDAACAVQTSSGLLPACDPNTAPAARSACFELTGTTLDIYQGRGVIQSFVKIAD